MSAWSASSLIASTGRGFSVQGGGPCAFRILSNPRAPFSLSCVSGDSFGGCSLQLATEACTSRLNLRASDKAIKRRPLHHLLSLDLTMVAAVLDENTHAASAPARPVRNVLLCGSTPPVLYCRSPPVLRQRSVARMTIGAGRAGADRTRYCTVSIARSIRGSPRSNARLASKQERRRRRSNKKRRSNSRSLIRRP